ncbi:MAG: ABC transporter substrate-binding protein [Candidatus Limnocylindrales bacterium]|nr:ABC transporter substrate-binding protein [Candidatus Limnocylindrales bacterium]
MTRTDTFVVGTLVVLFAIIAGLVGVPALTPPAPSTAPSASLAPIVSRPYREGVVGHPVSISPLTARTQADRDLVALIFSGLVKNGPSGTLLPDLAESWAVDPSGASWSFEVRADARWHDGEPVTAEDVAFTIRTLQDPGYTGPAAGSWKDATVETVGTRTVIITLANPLGGFLQAATQPIAPAHLLADVPLNALADDPFGQRPVGSGPFALVRLDEETAELVPAAVVMPTEAPSPVASASTVDSLATPAPTARPSQPMPHLEGIEFRYFESPDALAAVYRQGELDAASGLPPAVAGELAATPGSRMLRYPGSTLTAVLFNLRPRHAFASPALRTALLAAIDRPALIDKAFAGAAGAATSLIPPTSPLFDSDADATVPYDVAAAQEGLKAAGWKKLDNAWRRPTDKKPLTFELLSPNAESNPGAYAAAAAVVADWNSIGIQVTHVPLAPGEFVTGRLATADFIVAVADVTIGRDPDLYPLLASSQTLTGGSNVFGLQDPALDKLLVAARKPGSAAHRAAAYSALQMQLAKGQYLLPLAFADEPIVVRDTLLGPRLRQVADRSDRFWDVLTWRLAADR